MSDVKRYIFTGGGMDEAFNPQPDDYLYVAASDYEALAAQLECGGYLTAAEARIATLEAALIKYFAHQMTCDLKRPCSCGWDATADSLGLKALAPQEPP